MKRLLRLLALPALLSAAIISSTPAHADPKPAAPANESYDALVAAYFSGKWDNLEPVFLAAAGSSPTAAQKADITYIRQSIAESRPSWWSEAKAGHTFSFHPTLFARTLNATFDPASEHPIQINTTAGKSTLTVRWAYADMDNPAEAEHGYSRGELADLAVWMNLGGADAFASVPTQALATTMTKDQHLQLDRYTSFRGDIAGIYYAAPRARRWGLFLFCLKHMQKYAGDPANNSHKAVAAAFLVTLLTSPDKYPSIKIPAKLAEDTEENLALAIKDHIEKNAWTLAEDKLIRDSMKALAAANDLTVVRTSKVNLPNGLTMSLNPDQDTALREKRDAWVKTQLAKLKK